MKTLLNEINENADILVKNEEIITENVKKVGEYLELTPVQLDEAVSSWLVKVKNLVSRNTLNPDKKQQVIKVLAALAAISNPDLAAALNDNGDLGSILFNAGGVDKTASNSALHKLAAIGAHPSVKGFISGAEKAVDDPQGIDIYTKEIQIKIDKVMNKLRGQERTKPAVDAGELRRSLTST